MWFGDKPVIIEAKEYHYQNAASIYTLSITKTEFGPHFDLDFPADKLMDVASQLRVAAERFEAMAETESSKQVAS